MKEEGNKTKRERKPAPARLGGFSCTERRCRCETPRHPPVCGDLPRGAAALAEPQAGKSRPGDPENTVGAGVRRRAREVGVSRFSPVPP